MRSSFFTYFYQTLLYSTAFWLLCCSTEENSPGEDCFCTINFRAQDVNIGDNALGYQTAQWNSTSINRTCNHLLNETIEIQWSLYTYSGQFIENRISEWSIAAADIENATCIE